MGDFRVMGSFLKVVDFGVEWVFGVVDGHSSLFLAAFSPNRKVLLVGNYTPHELVLQILEYFSRLLVQLDVLSSVAITLVDHKRMVLLVQFFTVAIQVEALVQVLRASPRLSPLLCFLAG